MKSEHSTEYRKAEGIQVYMFWACEKIIRRIHRKLKWRVRDGLEDPRKMNGYI